MTVLLVQLRIYTHASEISWKSGAWSLAMVSNQWIFHSSVVLRELSRDYRSIFRERRMVNRLQKDLILTLLHGPDAGSLGSCNSGKQLTDGGNCPEMFYPW